MWPTVIVDEAQVALGLAYSNSASLKQAMQGRRGIYHSRRRGLWTKGSTSGATQELLAVDVDCDRDCLRFTVRQSGAGFCHQDTRTCWGPDRGLGRLARRLGDRQERPLPGSVTNRLMHDPVLLAAKIREEAEELCLASSPGEVRHEVADLLYFSLVRAAQAGVTLEQIEALLDKRELRVSRRPCASKEQKQ
ncbi:MAG: phosphoribosyl-ATP pyrophosphohydrolase [Planctomycetota bacterium]